MCRFLDRDLAAVIVGGVIVVLLMGVSLEAQQMVTVPVEIAAYPDILLYNGKIASMDDRTISTSPGTFYQAMAVREEKIVALGATDSILRLAGPSTWRIDLKGKTVIPGFIDPHSHMHNHALSYWLTQHPEVVEETLRTFSVEGNTYAELKRRIEVVLHERVKTSRPEQWTFINVAPKARENAGSGMAIGTRFLQEKQFTKQEMDAITPENPVMLQAHPSYVLNKAALSAIEKMYGLPVGKDDVQEDGFLSDTAWQRRALVIDGYFADKTDQLGQIILDGIMTQSALGITSWSSHIMGLEFFDAIMRLNRRGQMPIRFAYTHYFGFQANPDPASFYLRMGDMAGFGDDYFWQAAVGLGSVDSGPPRMCVSMEASPQVKSKEWCKNFPGSATQQAIYVALLAGQRIALGHSYGDMPVEYLMDDLENAMEQKADITLDFIRSRRHTSDHCGFYPRPDQIPRIANLGLIISCDPQYLTRSYPWLEVYGMRYANRVVPLKSMLEGGIRTVMEVEERVESGSGNTYFSHFMAPITRENRYGELVSPEEALDRVQVMKMTTVWPSEYIMKEDKLGTLEKGKLADFLVLNKDFFTVPQEEIPSIFPLMTVMGGKVRVLRKEWAAELGREPLGPQIDFDLAGKSRIPKPPITP